VDGGAASSTAPAGVSLSGATLSVDPTDAAFNHLAVGQSQVVVVSYQVRDAQGATVDQTETITIHGTNDAPTDIALSGTTIAEHATGTVGALTTTDVDTADTHAYSIVGGTGQSLFAISGGNLVVNAGIELSPEANKNYTLDIRTNDGHGGVYTETFTVTVTNDTADDVVIATLPQTSTGPDSSDSGVTGASSSSAITGNNDGNLLYGHTGGDKINGNGGNDTIYGGAGNDTINGNSESDIIYGGSGNDSIDGGNGNDTLIGGTGADSVTGGSDSDWIRYLTLQDTNDVITGFTRGTDKIDLTAIDANAATGANDTFGFVAAAVSDVIVQANSVTWQQNGANVEVYADTDGDLTTAEFHITLLNVTGLSASDFDTL
jgi:Ca2+-binding RTX toxin-like protein